MVSSLLRHNGFDSVHVDVNIVVRAVRFRSGAVWMKQIALFKHVSSIYFKVSNKIQETQGVS